MAAAPMQRPRDRFLPIAVGIGLVAILAALVLWLWPHGASDIQRQRVIQEITVVQPPPPPPPPPEPEEKIMEEQEVIQPARRRRSRSRSKSRPRLRARPRPRPRPLVSTGRRMPDRTASGCPPAGEAAFSAAAAVAAAAAGAVSWKGIFVAPCSAIPARGRRRASCA